MKESSEQQFSDLVTDVVANWRLVAGIEAFSFWGRFVKVSQIRTCLWSQIRAFCLREVVTA